MYDRPVKAGEVFTTFIFDGKDCADMGVYSVTNSGTYTYKIVPTFKDETLDVPAYDGQYFYGTQLSTQDFVFNMFADNLSLKEYQALKTWLFPQKIGKLIMPDQPFKYYIVKVKSVGDLGELPLTDIQTPTYSALGDHNEGNVVYVGRFTVTFQTVGSVYGYGMSYYRDDLIYDALDWYGKDVYPDNYYYDSGLLYRDMSPSLEKNIPANAQDFNLTWYNPGTAKAVPVLTLELQESCSKGAYIQINNETLNSTTVIDLSGLEGTVTIDTDEETIVDENSKYYFGRFSGNPIMVSPEKDVIYIPESLVETTEQFYFQDYDNIYITNHGEGIDKECLVEINPLATRVDANWKDNYYFCINDNGGALIIDANVNENTLLLDPEVETIDLQPSRKTIQDGREVIIPGGMKCQYIGEVDTPSGLPASAENGDVCLVKTYNGAVKIRDNYGDEIEYPQRNDVMFMYRYGQWKLTNLFTEPEEFYEGGELVPRYLIFGANVIKMDKITISTNIGPCTLTASILPRYV